MDKERLPESKLKNFLEFKEWFRNMYGPQARGLRLDWTTAESLLDEAHIFEISEPLSELLLDTENEVRKVSLPYPVTFIDTKFSLEKHGPNPEGKYPRKSDRWSDEPVTERQKGFLDSRNINYDSNTTKGEARRKLEQAYNHSTRQWGDRAESMWWKEYNPSEFQLFPPVLDHEVTEMEYGGFLLWETDRTLIPEINPEIVRDEFKDGKQIHVFYNTSDDLYRLNLHGEWERFPNGPRVDKGDIEEGEAIRTFVMNFLDFLNSPEVEFVEREPRPEPREKKGFMECPGCGKKLANKRAVKKHLKGCEKGLPDSRVCKLTGRTKEYVERFEKTGKKLRRKVRKHWVRGHWRRLRSDFYTEEKRGTKTWVPPHTRGEGVTVPKSYRLEKEEEN